MTITADALFRLGGLRFVPRTKKEATTWVSLHVAKSVQEALAREARKEDRSQSKMGEILLKEALSARGVDIPPDDEQQHEPADEAGQ